MTEQEKWQLEIDEAREEAVAHRWMHKRMHDYHPCEANGRMIDEYLKSHNLSFTEEDLDRALVALGNRLAKPSVAVAPPTVAAPPAEPTLDSVAPIPTWFPPMSSRADIARIHHEKYKRLLYGPHSEAFKRRLDAIQQGYQNAPTTPVAPATQTAPVVDDGLPPAPTGLTWASTVREVNAMSREEFRALYHSKVYGDQFRKRVDAIYARERGQR